MLKSRSHHSDSHDATASQSQKETVVAKAENSQDNAVPCPAEDTLSGDDVWMLIRRFNKEIYHVKSKRRALPHELDLTRAEEESFSPEKLRTTIEWFYMSVVIGLFNISYHIANIRSWKQPRRTAVFCAVYFTAWLCDLIILVFISILVLMILSTSFQAKVLPPECLLGNDDSKSSHPTLIKCSSLTGAPEAHKGETAETEATNLVRDLAEVTLESAVSEFEDEPGSPGDFEASTGLKRMPTTVDDGTREQMMQKVSKAMVEGIRVMSDITEAYERLCNLMSPTPPFDMFRPRLRIVGFLAVVGAMGLLPTYWLVKMGTFVAGFAFFGDPVFQWGLRWLSRRCPDWRGRFDLTEIVLKDVPTNAQLTLTLLRLGEMTASPLTSPPGPSDKDNQSVTRRQQPAPVPPAEALALEAAGLPFPALIKLVRGAIGVGIGLRLVVDRAIAIVGMSHPPHLIRMLRHRGWVSAPVGPLTFKAQLDHRRGTAVIDSSLEPPVFYFTTHSGVRDMRMSSQHQGSVLFQIPVPDIMELKKTEKLGWKQKLILEITGGIKYSVDGLIVRGESPSETYHLTAIKERDQLFNRLVAIGAQFWENW